MPSQMILHPGLKCHVQLLQGQLSATHRRIDNKLYNFQMSGSDLEGEEEEHGSEESARQHDTAEISAVGLRITILKNDGLLKVKFLGEEGAKWTWEVDGLDVKVVSGGMAVQTLDAGIVSRQKGKDSHTQTVLSIPTTISDSELSRLLLGATLQEKEMDFSRNSFSSRDQRLTGEPVMTEANKKRKLSPTRFPRSQEPQPFEMRRPLGPVFPRHLRLHCLLLWPKHEHDGNDPGILHVDTSQGRAWYEIQDDRRVLRQTQIQLDPNTLVDFQRMESPIVKENRTYDGRITIEGYRDYKFIVITSSKERVWGNENFGQRVEFSTHHIMFNALRDCVRSRNHWKRSNELTRFDVSRVVYEDLR